MRSVFTELLQAIPTRYLGKDAYIMGLHAIFIEIAKSLHLLGLYCT